MTVEKPIESIPEDVNLSETTRLLGTLRGATKLAEGDAHYVIRDSSRRLRTNPRYRRRLRTELEDVVARFDATDLLSEAGMLSDESLSAGVIRRLGGSVAPLAPVAITLRDIVDSIIKPSDRSWLEVLSVDEITTWVEALLLPDEDDESRTRPTTPKERKASDDDVSDYLERALAEDSEDDTESEEPPDDFPAVQSTRTRRVRNDLASACVLLSARITGAGAHPRLIERLHELDNWDSPFIQLHRHIEQFAEAMMGQRSDELDIDALEDCLDDCETVIHSFRAEKRELGTNLELSSLSLRVAQQIHRLQHMVEVVRPNRYSRAFSIAVIARDTLLARSDRYRVGQFIREKFDLLAYLTVGHAARQGSKYVVHDQKEYARFFSKSFGGGMLVAAFASLKLWFSHASLAPLPQGLLYGVNYAICFALIYLLGATLATKQPAMTASRLASSLEGKANADRFPELVQAIWRSQFISFVGNVAGAALFAIVIAAAFLVATKEPMVSSHKAEYLMKSLHPTKSWTIYYAAVAGVMLSLSGFISAYVDNFVVFHRVSKRIENGRGLFQRISEKHRAALARNVDEKTGALTGNITLGFMLGTAGTIGILLGIPFDIRHIAFASSHTAISLFNYPGELTLSLLVIAAISVTIIGLVNFVVSFGLTMIVAIESRKVKGVSWRVQLNELRRLILRDPLYFFLPLPAREAPSEEELPG